MNGVAISASAKVNLRLAVLAREESGFHSLETIYCGISLADQLVIERSLSGIHLDVTGSIDAGPPEKNLVRRAALRFYQELETQPAIRISLHKTIPAQAGLGGGSSDAAATLRALNLLHDTPFDDAALLEWGASLGSDVPFFLAPTPFALAWGRGERILHLEPPPARHVLIVNPGIAIPTADAFAHLAELRSAASADGSRTRPALFDVGTLSTWHGLLSCARNDFEPVAAERVGGLRELLERLREVGATIALLSGSGSAVFAIFESEEHLDEAERVVLATGFTARRERTLERWPAPEFRD